MALAGVNELAKALKRAGLAPPNLGNLLGIGLTLLGKPTNIDGKPAIEISSDNGKWSRLDRRLSGRARRRDFSDGGRQFAICDRHSLAVLAMLAGFACRWHSPKAARFQAGTGSDDVPGLPGRVIRDWQ